MAATNQKLQLLADALALGFSQSLASAQCAGTLKRLLPGLEYLCITVTNPAQAGSIVASANCAAEGPTTLHLHDLLSSVSGLALERRQPMQTSLLGGEAKIVPKCTDVQEMVVAAPAVVHLLCIPFGCGSRGSENSGTPACKMHGSSSGALLFGLGGPPLLDDRRKMMLALLAQCLPGPMARLSANTLAFVNFACGNNVQCSCCCPHDSEEEEDVEPKSPCSGDRHSKGGGGGSAPSQALAAPHAEPQPAEEARAAASRDRAGPSSSQWQGEPGEDKRSGKVAAEASAATDRMPLEGCSQEAPLSLRFSKALVSAAGEDKAVAAQSSLTLTFRSPLMEREYGQWISKYLLKVDLLFSLLLATALVIVSLVRPCHLLDLTPGSPLLGLGMLLPLAVGWVNRGLYSTWRNRLVVAMRLYVVAFINLLSLRSYQAHMAPERVQQWITFWMLTGTESLCVIALGFPVRMQLHLPLQFAAVGTAAWNLPRMCSECYPVTDASVCFKSSAAMAAVFGYLLPTVCLRCIEQRSRSIFANQLHAAAAH